MEVVNGSCLGLATYSFEEPVKVSELRDYLGTDEFMSRLPKAKLWPSAAEIDDATNKRVDGPRIRAVRLMDKLRKEFLKAPRPDEPDKEPTSAISVWRVKLEFLLVEEAKASDRARLFHDVKLYPWTSPQEDLAAARKLIEQCGYWRRKEELEDAEEAAKSW